MSNVVVCVFKSKVEIFCQALTFSSTLVSRIKMIMKIIFIEKDIYPPFTQKINLPWSKSRKDTRGLKKYKTRLTRRSI